jgi:MFS family permease
MWPRVAERTIGHGRTLRILAWLTTVTAILLWLAAIDLAPDWVLVPGVLFLGGGAVAWNAVGMLAVMDLSPHGLVGKGTGVVLFGFLFGLAIGPPIMGYSVDTLGSYGPGWLTAAVLLFVSGMMAFKIPSGTTVANPVSS